MKTRFTSCVLLVLVVLAASAALFGQAKEDKSLLLDLGDPRYRLSSLDVAPGVITSAETGKPVTLAQMTAELAGCRFVYVGESHNSLPAHDIEYQVIKALFEKDRNVTIGLEMYPVTLEEPLAKWSLGLLAEDEFLAQGQWYINWNFNFGYYRPIFDYAKLMKIPVHGLNIPREIVVRIRMGGRESLTEEQKKLVPPLDLTNPDHRKLFRTIFESSELPPQMKGAGNEAVFEALYRAQVAWDVDMAANARRAGEIENRRVVVLAGSGHLLYNLGINMRVFEKNHQPFKTVIPVAVPADKKTLKVSRGMADFIWGYPEEKRPAFPDIGLSFKKFAGLDNLVIDRKPFEGAAGVADFEKGDIILNVDGKPYSDINALRGYLAGFGWDQEVKFHVLRGGQEQDVILKLVEAPVAPLIK